MTQSMRVLTAAALLGFAAEGLSAQQPDTVFYSADDYTIEEPATCPTRLRPGFTGYFYGYPHAGYEWPASWERHTVLSAAFDLADYIPLEYDGYGVAGPYITSLDDAARWFNARIRTRCTRTIRYVLGRVWSVTERFRITDNFGEVVKCGSGQSEDEIIMDAAYNPYDPSISPIAGSCGDGGSGENDPEPGDDWYEDIDGVQFHCYHYATDSGLRVTHCDALA
jgi:hypothetical protein